MRLIGFAFYYAWIHSRDFDRRSWVRYTGWLTILLAFTFGLLGTRYLVHVHANEVRAQLYLLIAFIGHFGLLAALLGVPLLAIVVLIPSRLVLLVVAPAMVSATLLSINLAANLQKSHVLVVLASGYLPARSTS